MPTPIRFAGKVEASEMLRAYKLAWRGTWQMRARIAFYCAGAAFIVAFGIVGLHAFQHDEVRAAWRIWIPAILLVACLIMSARNLHSRVARSLKYGVFNEFVEVIIDNKEFVYSDGKASLRITWEKLTGIRGNDEIAVLYISYPRSFLAFFRRLSATPDDWDRFIALADERLPRM